MSGIDWYIECVTKKYCCFDGRARRKEFWMFTLFNCLVSIVVCGVAQAFPGADFITAIYPLAICLPQFGVSVRRLHDVGLSGWWVAAPNMCLAISFVLPGLFKGVALTAFLVSSIALLVVYCQSGTAGENAYGPDPKRECADGET